MPNFTGETGSMALSQQLDSVTQQAVQNFSALEKEQLNWKPEPSKWSIGQCLDHLITTNSSYFPAFDKLLAGEYRLSLFQRLNPFKKLLGPLMIKSLGPQPTKKLKTPKLFRPASSDVPRDMVKRFSDHQQRMKTYYSRLQQLDINRIVIASPVTGFITFSLGDCLQALAGHEQRHLNQALNVLNHPHFPK